MLFQVVQILRDEFLAAGLPLYLVPYSVIPSRTGADSAPGGIIQVQYLLNPPNPKTPLPLSSLSLLLIPLSPYPSPPKPPLLNYPYPLPLPPPDPDPDSIISSHPSTRLFLTSSLEIKSEKQARKIFSNITPHNSDLPVARNSKKPSGPL